MAINKSNKPGSLIAIRNKEMHRLVTAVNNLNLDDFQTASKPPDLPSPATKWPVQSLPRFLMKLRLFKWVSGSKIVFIIKFRGSGTYENHAIRERRTAKDGFNADSRIAEVWEVPLARSYSVAQEELHGWNPSELFLGRRILLFLALYSHILTN